LADYLPQPIPQLPPDTDKIASLIFRPDFGALLLEDYDHGLNILRSRAADMPAGAWSAFATESDNDRRSHKLGTPPSHSPATLAFSIKKDLFDFNWLSPRPSQHLNQFAVLRVPLGAHWPGKRLKLERTNPAQFFSPGGFAFAKNQLSALFEATGRWQAPPPAHGQRKAPFEPASIDNLR
jgi:hypothetical protein